MSAEVEVVSEVQTWALGVPAIDEKNLPEVIQGQVTKLENLSESVEKAKKAAQDAKASADNAKSISAGIFFNKNAIEGLQSAGMALAEAAQSAAEAQKISFEFQTKLAEITKYLFGLGVSNIAANRFVVRELELRLKGASQDGLSELARQELQLVLQQLKDQHDVLIKQENFAKAHRELEERLDKAAANIRSDVADLTSTTRELSFSIQAVGIKSDERHQELQQVLEKIKTDFFDAMSVQQQLQRRKFKQLVISLTALSLAEFGLIAYLIFR